LRSNCDSNLTNLNASMVGTSILMLNINLNIVIISYNNLEKPSPCTGL
jgi:hypothetical protein